MVRKTNLVDLVVEKETKNIIYKAASAIDRGYEIIETLLLNRNGISFSQLRNETGLNSNSLTYRLWKLMELGIIERQVVNPDKNGRYSFYRLTDPGARIVEKFEELKASKILG